MTWIDLLEMAILGTEKAISLLKPETSKVDAALAAELTAGLEKLRSAHAQAVKLEELESLRTTPLW